MFSMEADRPNSEITASKQLMEFIKEHEVHMSKSSAIELVRIAKKFERVEKVIEGIFESELAEKELLVRKLARMVEVLATRDLCEISKKLEEVIKENEFLKRQIKIMDIGIK